MTQHDGDIAEASNGTAGAAPRRRLSSNVTIAVLCVSVFAGMIGLSYASVPLYRLFCQVTGYGGTTQAVASADGIPVLDRQITVRFDANVAPTLNLDFKPVERAVTLKLGEVRQIAYMATNTTDETVYGTATFNVTPQQAGAYFNKLECFCFTETKIAPGESLEMPVVFFVDPEMVDYEETRGLHTLTLSYTFFPAPEPDADVKTSRSAVRTSEPAGG